LAKDLRSYATVLNQLANWLDPRSAESWKLEFRLRESGSHSATDEDVYRFAKVRQLLHEGMEYKEAISAVAKERRCSDGAVKVSIGRIKKRFGRT